VNPSTQIMTNAIAARVASVTAPEGESSRRALGHERRPARGGRFVRREDRDLVQSVRAGDSRAFELVYERYQRRIAAYVQGMVRDHGRAEDVTQEVFVSALRRLRSSEQPIALRPWLYEIARNACIDQFRRSARTKEVSYERDPSEAERGLSGVPAPEEAVDTKQRLDHLRDALCGLSDVQRDILVMRELEGLSYREIGRRLHLSRPAVESALFRARRRLGYEYEQLSSGARCVHVQQAVLAGHPPAPSNPDRAQVAAHLSRCPACRLHARMAALDRRRPTERLGALVPVAILPRWLRGLGAGTRSAPLVGARSGQVGGWSSVFSRVAEPAVGLLTVGAAAVALASLGPATPARPALPRHGRAMSTTTATGRLSPAPGVVGVGSWRTLGPISVSLDGFRPVALLTRSPVHARPLRTVPASPSVSSPSMPGAGGRGLSSQTVTTQAAGTPSRVTPVLAQEEATSIALPAQGRALGHRGAEVLAQEYRSLPVAPVVEDRRPPVAPGAAPLAGPADTPMGAGLSPDPPGPTVTSQIAQRLAGPVPDAGTPPTPGGG